MTDKMTLLFVKKTGHVLAFMTRESDPETTPKPEELAGEALLVRYAGNPKGDSFAKAQFLVSPDELAVEVKDFDDLVVTRPRDFYLDTAKKVVVASGVLPDVMAVGNSGINVILPANVTATTPVWIQVSRADPTKTQIRKSDIDDTKNNTILSLLPLDSGDHYVLALVAGYAAVVKKIYIHP